MPMVVAPAMTPPAMTPVPPEKVAELCAQAAQGEVVSCANFNDPSMAEILRPPLDKYLK